MPIEQYKTIGRGGVVERTIDGVMRNWSEFELFRKTFIKSNPKMNWVDAGELAKEIYPKRLQHNSIKIKSILGNMC